MRGFGANWPRTGSSAGKLVKVTLRYGDKGTIRRIGALLEGERVQEQLLRKLERALKPSTSLIPWIPMKPKRGIDQPALGGGAE